ncbi:MAG: phosphatase PAP2 family protein, partial [Gemmatimonadetes bacterium]|nr:phosphatase PAP2 family protein [Gemmatimonadota bacterium]
TFGVPTPPVPEFPSAHATAGGAAAAILEATFGRVEFSMSSTTLPGAVRTFHSIGAAARENAESRVFIGYHFRHATEVGLDQGRRIGQFVVRNGLPRN